LEEIDAPEGKEISLQVKSGTEAQNHPETGRF
jgi:hypothetical protein